MKWSKDEKAQILKYLDQRQYRTEVYMLEKFIRDINTLVKNLDVDKNGHILKEHLYKELIEIQKHIK